ncbi:MAG: sulfurtransferase TusA family protein [Candidatus Omnitrophota bacterium]|nr:sulfurtransferase TusA family protein [Candidatus Omnitrophota bacterium]
MEEPKINKELNLKRTAYPNNFVTAKLALGDLEFGHIVKIIVDNESSAIEIPKAIEHEGHKILEVRKLNQNDWEIVVQKHNGGYVI